MRINGQLTKSFFLFIARFWVYSCYEIAIFLEFNSFWSIGVLRGVIRERAVRGLIGIQGQLPLTVTRVNSFLVLSLLKSKMCKRFKHYMLIFERNPNEIYRSIIKTLSWLEIFAKKMLSLFVFWYTVSESDRS